MDENVIIEMILNGQELNKILGDDYITFSISDLSSIGGISNEIINFINNNCPGGEGIYKVTFPEGVKGTLHKFKNESAFLGSINGENGLAQARLTNVSFDPAQLMIAMALVGINNKLNSIMEMQQKMISFMYDVQESNVLGNIKQMGQLIEDYKNNWKNEMCVKSYMDRIGVIKADTQKSIELYRKQINSILSASILPHGIQGANKKVNELTRFVSMIHMSYYLMIFAVFYDFLIVNNYEENNIKYIQKTIRDYDDEYNDIYKNASEWIEKYMQSSLDKKLAPVMEKMDSFYANILEKAPYDFDKLYKSDAALYENADMKLDKINAYKNLGIESFDDGIKKIGYINSIFTNMYIDKNNVYLINE